MNYLQALELMQQGKIVKCLNNNCYFKIESNKLLTTFNNIIKQEWFEFNTQLNTFMQLKFEEYIENPKIDYSKWIGRCGNNLCIFGNKMLKSNNHCDDISITYSNTSRENFNDELHYETVEMKDLKYGDVVDLKPEYIRKDYCNFGVFMGRDDTFTYYFTKIPTYCGVEVPSVFNSSNMKVNRFLRE